MALAIACSDDGVPATTEDPSAGSTGSATAASATAGTDPTTMTGTTAESSITDTGPESTGTSLSTSTSDDTSGSVTNPSDTSSDGTGSDSTTGDPGEPCTAPSECQIVDNCCDCTALPEGVDPPECNMPCDQTACAAIGIDPIAACDLGSCELQPVPCNPLEVSCESKPPACGDGNLPGVDPDTMCWTGDCVPAEFCDVVSSCADCAPDEVCVEMVAQLPTVTCSPIPEACEGVPSCACMGDDVCVSPFDLCSDDQGTITCSCPAC